MAPQKISSTAMRHSHYRDSAQSSESGSQEPYKIAVGSKKFATLNKSQDKILRSTKGKLNGPNSK